MKRIRTELPVVEKGIPLPVLKYQPGSRAVSRSPWAEFLRGLAPGDSFVIHRFETQSVMLNAKRHSVCITWRTLPDDAAKLRVWRVPEDVIPVKAKRTKWVPSAELLLRRKAARADRATRLEPSPPTLATLPTRAVYEPLSIELL